MREIYKIIIIAFCAVLIMSFFKSMKSEYSYYISFSCGILILGVLIPCISSLIIQIKNLFSFTAQSNSLIKIFLKCVLICEICSLTKDFCRDSSNNFIASCVDITEKTAVLIATMPLMEAVVKIIVRFIGK